MKKKLMALITSFQILIRTLSTDKENVKEQNGHFLLIKVNGSEGE